MVTITKVKEIVTFIRKKFSRIANCIYKQHDSAEESHINNQYIGKSYNNLQIYLFIVHNVFSMKIPNI